MAQRSHFIKGIIKFDFALAKNNPKQYSQMYQTQCIKIKVKPGKAETFKTWARQMDQVANQELAELLAKEGVVTEQMFLDKHGEDYYIYFFTKARNLATANEVFNQSQHPINQRARAMINECWDLSTAHHIEILADWEGIRV